MIYDQTVNPLKRDLLWGVSIKDCVKDRKNNVEITMVHALAKVNISFEKSLGDKIGTVIVSAYKTGRFSRTLDDGIPDWDVDDKTEIDATFGFEYLQKNNPTVFILPGKITRLRLFANFGHYDEIYDSNASDEIQKYTFKAGKEYNLKISSTGVRKKNTNSRSIAMSVRCVSE